MLLLSKLSVPSQAYVTLVDLSSPVYVISRAFPQNTFKLFDFWIFGFLMVPDEGYSH
jgi:hypothetical protein